MKTCHPERSMSVAQRPTAQSRDLVVFSAPGSRLQALGSDYLFDHPDRSEGPASDFVAANFLASLFICPILFGMLIPNFSVFGNLHLARRKKFVCCRFFRSTFAHSSDDAPLIRSYSAETVSRERTA